MADHNLGVVRTIASKAKGAPASTCCVEEETRSPIFSRNSFTSSPSHEEQPGWISILDPAHSPCAQGNYFPNACTNSNQQSS
jgi:hypothetical protein